MRFATLVTLIVNTIGIVSSNQPDMYTVTTEHRMNVESEATFTFSNQLKCVWTCRRTDSCVAVNIRNSGRMYLCDILASRGSLIEEAEASYIGMFFSILQHWF